MKFSSYKDDLSAALKTAAAAVAVKPQTPVLSGVYLKAEGDVLEVQTNNYSTGIITRIPVNTEEPGEVVVGFKKFQEFVEKMPDRTLACGTVGNALTVESGGANVSLITMTAADFPKVKTLDDANTFKIRTATLRELIRKTIYAVDKNNTARPIFTGCHFDFKGNTLALVATNTHRLAVTKDTLQLDRDPFSFVVPAVPLVSILNHLDPKDTDNFVTINFSGRAVTFTFDNVFLTARLIEGVFPPYDRVIPSGSTTRVRVATKDFKDAVDLVALISKENEYKTIKLNISGAGIEISADSREIGDAVKTVEATVEGDDLDIAFNAEYLSDVLKVIDSSGTNIAFNDKFSPAAVTASGDADTIHVVTPVRV